MYWYYNITTVVLHKTSKNTYIHYYIIYYYDGRRYLGRHEGTVKTVTTNCGGAGWRGTGVTEADPKDCYRRRVGTRARVCVCRRAATSSGGSGGYSAGPRSTGFSSVARLH